MSNSCEGKKVLIVEDEEPMRHLMKDKYEGAEFDVIEAHDGEEGLAKAISEKPDVIILDLMMPKMDGMTMMAKLRESGEWGKKVPIIILTNLEADDQILQGVVNDQPSYYFIKSSQNINDLIAKTKEALGIDS